LSFELRVLRQTIHCELKNLQLKARLNKVRHLKKGANDMRTVRLMAGSCVVVLLIAASVKAATSDIADAAMKRNMSVLRSLLQKADVNAAQTDGTTALHWAVRLDDLEMADLLIRAGANVKATNRLGVTPLSLACINGNAAMIEKLLKAGADPNAALSELGETPLMMASRTGDVGAVKVLLDHGANVNAKESSKGQTALMWAASETHPAVMKMLIDHGADVNARSNDASIVGRGLYDRAPAAGGNAGGGTPAAGTPAAEGPDDAAFKKIEQESDIDARLALLLDFEKKFPSSKLLLDVYQFMIQIYEKKNDQPKLLATKDKAVGFDRRQRLGGGANLQRGAVTTGGITALILATREGDSESARMLLAAGADVNTRMANGSTALLVAILNGHYQLSNFLLDHGANPNLADMDGRAPLYAAVEMRNYEVTDTPGPEANKAEALDLTKALLNHGADPNARLTAKTPYRGGINRTWLPEPGATPFYRAAASGDINVMRLLLAYGADPYIAAKDNTTPLMVAAGIGFLGRETYVWPESDALEALKLCLQFNDVNAANNTGLTALIGAAFRGWNAAVQLMVNKGGKLDQKDKAGRIPLNWADGAYKNSRSPDTVALIQKLMQ
jgi:uncharacterized protein